MASFPPRLFINKTDLGPGAGRLGDVEAAADDVVALGEAVGPVGLGAPGPELGAVRRIGAHHRGLRHAACARGGGGGGGAEKRNVG